MTRTNDLTNLYRYIYHRLAKQAMVIDTNYGNRKETFGLD
jgi:hypothetical protein